MRDKLISILEATGHPAYMQGSFAEDEEYPDTFFTFWEFMIDHHYYDNVPTTRDHGYWVYCYSSDPIKIETLMEELEQALRAAGFIPEGGPIDLKSDVETHMGKLLTVYYKEVIA